MDPWFEWVDAGAAHRCRSVPGYQCTAAPVAGNWVAIVYRTEGRGVTGYVYHSGDAGAEPADADAAMDLCEAAVRADLGRGAGAAGGGTAT